MFSQILRLFFIVLLFISSVSSLAVLVVPRSDFTHFLKDNKQQQQQHNNKKIILSLSWAFIPYGRYVKCDTRNLKDLVFTCGCRKNVCCVDKAWPISHSTLHLCWLDGSQDVVDGPLTFHRFCAAEMFRCLIHNVTHILKLSLMLVVLPFKIGRKKRWELSWKEGTLLSWLKEFRFPVHLWLILAPSPLLWKLVDFR